MFGEFYLAYTTVFRGSIFQVSFAFSSLAIAARPNLLTNKL